MFIYLFSDSVFSKITLINVIVVQFVTLREQPILLYMEDYYESVQYS